MQLSRLNCGNWTLIAYITAPFSKRVYSSHWSTQTHTHVLLSGDLFKFVLIFNEFDKNNTRNGKIYFVIRSSFVLCIYRIAGFVKPNWNETIVSVAIAAYPKQSERSEERERQRAQQVGTELVNLETLLRNEMEFIHKTMRVRVCACALSAASVCCVLGTETAIIRATTRETTTTASKTTTPGCLFSRE